MHPTADYPTFTMDEEGIGKPWDYNQEISEFVTNSDVGSMTEFFGVTSAPGLNALSRKVLPATRTLAADEG